MKDYFTTLLAEKKQNTPEAQVSKGSKGQGTVEKEAFDPFDTERPRVFQDFSAMREERSFRFGEFLTTLVKRGIEFAAGIDKFNIVKGVDLLTGSEKEYLQVNYAEILGELQLVILCKLLFSHSAHLIEEFGHEVRERQAISADGELLSYEANFEAFRQTTAKWFDDLLQKRDATCRSIKIQKSK